MTRNERLVFDSNALVSRLLLPDSTPGRAVRKAVDEGQLLVSEATLMELAEVLSRPKFNQYVSLADRQKFLRLLGSVAELVQITYPIQACRDPKDDKFLELAVNGAATAIVTGDRDLLVLNPFHGVAILTPAGYLRR
ncbi:MAG: putative toxin-antitoxin system toxin component, PIN family [Betaproteobacteria bacterium RIFCSPLOWO2_02_FULL_66_14]|nr:MAG: putative toxin-antitoxin system toxin component, PIN family [Betaproteobacteria bacterium RIFCSPLOWO2_02_FULL_66_14]